MPAKAPRTVLAIVGVLMTFYLVRASRSFSRPVISANPQIHAGDLARAATRHILGPNAKVASRLGLWYTAGGAHWHEILYDLTYDVAVDPAAYLAHFDAAADDEFRSGESPANTRRTLSYWYSTGLLKLKGFYFSNDSDLRMVLLGLKNPANITGYVLRYGRLYRFDESSSGAQEVTVSICPARPEFRYPSLVQTKGVWSATAQDLPTLRGEPPRVIVTILHDSGIVPPTLRESCTELSHRQGNVRFVDHNALVFAFRRQDETIDFYPYKALP